MRRSYGIVLLAGLCAIASPAARAFDCSAARSDEDKAICADPEARAADEAMAASYAALAALLPAKEKPALLNNQRNWLKLRSNLCGAEEASSVPACLRRETRRRLNYLDGRPESGPGSGQKLVPVFLQNRGRRGEYDLDVALLKYAAPALPGEKLFNAEIGKMLKDAPAVKDPQSRQGSFYAYQQTMRMSYESPQFLSANVETYQFSGGAHGNSGVDNINLDLKRGRKLEFTDVFDEGAAAILDQDCLRQIERQKHEKMPDEALDAAAKDDLMKTISGQLPKLERWRFAAAEAEVEFNPYELGSYAEGRYQCRFGASVLRPLKKLDFVPPD
jgi:uncharacterized protein YecT (DUF1311 family)